MLRLLWKKPGPTLDLLSKVQPGLIQNILQKQPSLALHFILKARPGPMSLRTGADPQLAGLQTNMHVIYCRLISNLIQKLGSNLVRYKTKYFAWV